MIFGPWKKSGNICYGYKGWPPRKHGAGKTFHAILSNFPDFSKSKSDKGEYHVWLICTLLKTENDWVFRHQNLSKKSCLKKVTKRKCFNKCLCLCYNNICYIWNKSSKHLSVAVWWLISLPCSQCLVVGKDLIAEFVHKLVKAQVHLIKMNK